MYKFLILFSRFQFKTFYYLKKIAESDTILKLIKRLYITIGKFSPAFMLIARASNVANNTVLCDNKARLLFQRYSIRVTKAG